jgi:alkanesulfonate monooxygenase SsuD/methylene tetrahydromethanopterin reductase-like flavin-dependent oxidoreductase (luciferase family)
VEHRGLGVPFPPLAERYERLEETLQIALQMWADAGKLDKAEPFEGKFYRLERTLNVPQSLQRPHPPILIGGGGEQKTLRLVAQYANACNLLARLGDDMLRHKLDVLRSHCERLGRPYTAIEKTVALENLRLSQDGRAGTVTAAQALDAFAHLGELGFDHVIITLPNVDEPEVFDLLREQVVPVVERLPVTGRGSRDVG